jgi:two-component system response regulator NreC
MSDQASTTIPLRTVLIAEDHVVVRRGLRLLVESTPGLSVVAETGTVGDTVRKTRALHPDVLLLDLSLGDESSLPVVAQLAAALPEMAIVVLTMQDDTALARRALQDGARAYVLKEAAGDDLARAIDDASAGRVYLDPRLGARMALVRDQDAEPPDGLSRREAEVLRLIALGHTNAEIGSALHLSRRTVESHRTNIQRKTGQTSRAELVRYALDHGLLDAERA